MSKRNSHGSLSSKGSSQKVSTLSDNSPRDMPDRDDKAEGDSSKKQKLAFGIGKASAKPLTKLGIHGPVRKGIQIKLGAQKPTQQTTPVLSQSKAVAAVFNVDDEDSEPEEMPPEARMRMRNIGRETPTSAGPNSFGKTKQGFCDNKKMFEKTMKRAMDGSTIPLPKTGNNSE